MGRILFIAAILAAAHLSVRFAAAPSPSQLAAQFESGMVSPAMAGARGAQRVR